MISAGAVFRQTNPQSVLLLTHLCGHLLSKANKLRPSFFWSEISESETLTYVSVVQQCVMLEGDLFSNREPGSVGSCGPSGLQAPYGSVGCVLVRGAVISHAHLCILDSLACSGWWKPHSLNLMKTGYRGGCAIVVMITWWGLKQQGGDVLSFSLYSKVELFT